ncbi:DNA repair protein RadA [Desulfoprunum benzoelyticum]|uniref:DNA repair protein RadA n=1 Tax=Desulfoprunum benzoelyticum TaxID=1506996 RepID=A0A840V130_9BACT|nr:DNA repair protein RadA [Desulfoprunum benzoelyticum]MBB5347520.1 DNA repair protein RadA/Sms [Desulfoprunum benzoelyticum]MBM9529603.1 DNA repair protein RadA [Desulfoprunum benzoelyticum]
MTAIPRKKSANRYICQQCGYQSIKWLGRCPDCGGWETLVEETAPQPRSRSGGSLPAILLADAPDSDEERIATGMVELDRVLGGGIVPGSVILIGGEPGIGKSTLILHILAAVAASCRRKVLYVSGEESASQIKMRARRLLAIHEDEYLATGTEVEEIMALTEKMRPALLAVDSIQTMTCADLTSGPGSVGQVRETAYRLLGMAKRQNIPVILVGHVTKEGSLAGPKVLEHMVDTVLSFEGDRSHAFRILRTVKNRFGSTNEIGVFEMKEEGLVQVSNPSEIFLAERPLDEPGSVVLPSVEGTRPILVEVQALVSPTNLGTARRTAIGADPQRLALLCAVLEKKAGLVMYGHDIFLNIAGGIRIDEPALDLGVICALASSLRERPLSSATVVCGEVGLAGEIRAVGQIDIRLREAERLGFTRFIMPRSNWERCSRSGQIETVGVANLQELLEIIFE